MIVRVAFVLSIIFATSTAAFADTVWLHAGGEYGQGYIIARPSGCWLLTAAHVIATPPVDVIGSEGRQGFVDAASIVADTKLDIAVMRITGDLANNCPGSPLGDSDTEAALTRALHGNVGVNYESRNAGTSAGSVKAYGLQPVPVSLLGVPGQETFLVAPTKDAHAQLAPAFSGGPLLLAGNGDERGLPVGILKQILPNGEGVIVRWDLVRALLLAHEGTKAPVTATTTGYALGPVSGVTADAACGPPNLIDPGGTCGWRAQRRGPHTPIAVTLDLGAADKPVDRVIVQFAPNRAPRGFSVTTTDDPKDITSWAPGHYCAVPAGSTQVECGLGPRLINDVRVTFDGDTVEIARIRVIAATPELYPFGSAVPTGLKMTPSQVTVLSSWTTAVNASVKLLHVRVSLRPTQDSTADVNEFALELQSKTHGLDVLHPWIGAYPGQPVNPAEDLGAQKQVAVKASAPINRVLTFQIWNDDDISPAALNGLTWFNR